MFGLERVYKPKRKKQERRQASVGMTRERCIHCEKWGYRTEEAARLIIGRMLYNGSLHGPNVFTFKPYLCVHGWWHTGHDYKSQMIIHSKLKADALRAAHTIKRCNAA